MTSHLIDFKMKNFGEVFVVASNLENMILLKDSGYEFPAPVTCH